LLVAYLDSSSDDRLLSLCRDLEADGFEVEVADTIPEVMARFHADPPTLVLIYSLQWPTSWIDMCVEMHRAGDIPVVLGFAPQTTADTVLAVELGVVGYVHDPARTRELLARIRAAISIARDSSPQRTGFASRGGTYVAGEIRIDMDLHEVTVGGTPVHLARLEFDLLAVLLDPPRQVHTRAEIMRRVWEGRPSTTSRTLDTHIRWLRQKLEKDPTDPRYLITVWGVGFRFDAVKDELPVATA